MFEESDPTTNIIFGLVIMVIASAIGMASFFVWKGNTMPLVKMPEVTMKREEGFASEAVVSNKSRSDMEGFYGGAANGAGEPSCLRTLTDASAVYDELAMRCGGYEQAQKDLAELRLLVSKWACLKKDIMSPSGIVIATRSLPYSTLHDRIPVPDIAGQCNAKTIPARDLDITFDTWNSRAKYLFRRLAAGASISQGEAAKLEGKLLTSLRDVYEIAKSQCLGSVPAGKMNPRDAQPYTPNELTEHGMYSGYY
jgi:hypothetical protein